MKFILLLLLTSCAIFEINDYPNAISQIQFCWSQRKVSCITKYFGPPDEVSDEHIAYKEKTLSISRKGDNINSIAYWILDPQYANEKSVKGLLIANDWQSEQLPEKNPHVVNLAIANFSKKLDAAFITYRLDPEKKVKILYWGGNYKDMEF